MTGYKKHIFICENLRPENSGGASCGVHKTSEFRAKMKASLQQKGLHKQYRVNRSGCLGQCAKGPVMVIYPQGLWYSGFSASDVDEIIEESVIADNEIPRLLMK